MAKMSKITAKIIPLALALFLALPAAAWGKEVNFGLYTADVPNSWEISNQDGIVTLTNPEKSNVFLITVGLSEVAHKKRVAGNVAKFNRIIRENPNQNVTIMRIKGRRVVATILGDSPERVDIYYSIKEVPVDKGGF